MSGYIINQVQRRTTTMENNMDSKEYQSKIKSIHNDPYLTSAIEKQNAYDALKATNDNPAMVTWGDKYWCFLVKPKQVKRAYKLPEGLTKVLGIDEAMRHIGVDPKRIAKCGITINITIDVNGDK